MAMTKALKNRLQKIINAVAINDIAELWNEFSYHMKNREKALTVIFEVGDEIKWEDKTGTILKKNITTCHVRENDSAGTKWTISSSMLTKLTTIKI